MNDTTKTLTDELETMRLPELWARFAEVVGEVKKTPNRAYLIRRIVEAQAQAASEPATPVVAEQQGSSVGAAEPLRSPETHCESCGQLLVDGRCAECEARNAVDEQQVDDAQVATEEVGPSSSALPASTQATEPTAVEAAAPVAPVKLSKLTVPELQALYLEVVGRASGSVNRNYLIWKVKQAQKGKIPVGPRQPRRQRQAEGEDGAAGATQDFKVLPLRLEVSLVGKLDEAWARMGLKSRTELIRRALAAYLAGEGEGEVAALFTPRT